MHRRSARVLILAVSLGVAGALAGGMALYYSTTALYTSTGVILVHQTLPQMSPAAEPSSLTSMFDAYVGSQVELVRNQQVCDQAMRELALIWRGRGYSPKATAEFRRNMDVRRANDDQTIAVSFTDADRQYAEAAVTALIGAYLKVFGNIDAQGSDQTTKALTEQQATLNKQLSILRDKIDVLVQDNDMDVIDRTFARNLQDLHSLETDLKEAKLGLDLDSAVPATDRSGRFVNDTSSSDRNGPDRVQRLQIQYDKVKDQTQELSRKKRQIEQINEEMEQLRERLKQAKPLFDPQSATVAWRGDFKVASDDQLRTKPTRSHPGAQRAITGAAGGFILFALFGVVAGRLKSRPGV